MALTSAQRNTITSRGTVGVNLLAWLDIHRTLRPEKTAAQRTAIEACCTARATRMSFNSTMRTAMLTHIRGQ